MSASGLQRALAGVSSFQPQMAQVFADQLSNLRGILADSSREDQSINPAQRRGHCSDSLHQSVDIDLQSQASIRTVRGFL